MGGLIKGTLTDLKMTVLVYRSKHRACLRRLMLVAQVCHAGSRGSSHAGTAALACSARELSTLELCFQLNFTFSSF